ncbi:MAG: hypothetical protein K6T88_03100 [Bacillus sp. (in: Bacteria)]|nr:hypothetical protein [Bacillus sp. (in: firmicutes)]
MMSYNPFHFPIYPPMPANQGYPINYPNMRSYPPVDITMFKSSVHSFRFLMNQGSILLDRLADVGFAHKLMTAAQQGKKTEVDHLIKSIGLKVTVNTKFTPTGVHFELLNPPNQNTLINCCTLTVFMKWGS